MTAISRLSFGHREKIKLSISIWLFAAQVVCAMKQLNVLILLLTSCLALLLSFHQLEGELICFNFNFGKTIL